MLTQKQQIFEQINKASNILVTFSNDWSGDAISSALAMFLFLKKLDKKITIIADFNHKNDIFSFLPNFNEIKNNLAGIQNFIITLNLKNTKAEQVKYKIEDEKLNFIITPEKGSFSAVDISSSAGEYNFNLIITLDTPDLESLGEIYENNTDFFYHTPIINIDNHSGNESFGQINLIELTSVATAEILFTLFNDYSREIIDENIATCLLTGMIDKTRSFKTQNITPNSLTIASQLIALGAERDNIVNKLYRSRSLGVLKLWGRVLARLASDESASIIWSVITSHDFAKTASSEKNLLDVIDELIISIPTAKVIALIYEDEQKSDNLPQTTALIFSVRNIDSLQLIKELSPVGTKKIAKIRLNKSLKDAEQTIINLIIDKIKRLPIN
jgi:nanoRNase/pAp phosphatase (c-di-AMP/oligoRNAs hydrolase)